MVFHRGPVSVLSYSHSTPVDCFRLFMRICLTFIVLQTILNYIIKISFCPNDAINELSAFNAMESCVDDIRSWMLTDSLKLSDDKSEFLVIGTPQQLAKVNTHCIRVGDCNVSAAPSARNLGSWLHTKLSMATHITKLSGSSFYYLSYNIRRIRKYLSRRCAETLVHAFVSARIDYCNCHKVWYSWLEACVKTSFKEYRMLLPDWFASRVDIAISHPYFTICIGYQLNFELFLKFF